MSFRIQLSLVPPGTTRISDKQTNEIVYYRMSETDLREIPFVWRFTDTATGVFGGKPEYCVIGQIHRDP
jgi:hypothetical protein